MNKIENTKQKLWFVLDSLRFAKTNKETISKLRNTSINYINCLEQAYKDLEEKQTSLKKRMIEVVAEKKKRWCDYIDENKDCDECGHYDNSGELCPAIAIKELIKELEKIDDEDK